MITLHRLGHKLDAFQLNADLITTVEATPDTVITLTNGHKIVVAETPERVADAVRAQRIEVLAGAMDLRATLRAAGHPLRRRAGLLAGQSGGADVTPLPVSASDSTARA
jgi:flagellar protein FlbD